MNKIDPKEVILNKRMNIVAFKVKKITTIVEERGGRVSWGDNDMIAYGGLGEHSND